MVRPQPRFYQGSEIRRVEARCGEGGRIKPTSFSIVELPDGFVLRFGSFNAGVANTDPEQRSHRVENAGILRAATRGQ